MTRFSQAGGWQQVHEDGSVLPKNGSRDYMSSVLLYIIAVKPVCIMARWVSATSLENKIF